MIIGPTVDDVAVFVPEGSRFSDTWPTEFDRLRSLLAAEGLTARAVRMSATPPTDMPVLALLAWGYHFNPTEWLRRIAMWEAMGVWLINPASVLRWNTSKAYMAAFHAAGLPVIPSVAVNQITSTTLPYARTLLGSETLVAKPIVGACAHGAEILAPGFLPTLNGPALLQPYYPSIATVGELSLIFMGGCFSHAVRKWPANDDFRVQAEYGGSAAASSCPPEAFSVARDILAAAPEGHSYARVDLVQNSEGHYRLMELELIEPQLFLDLGSRGLGPLADAIRRPRPPTADSAQL